MISEKDFMARYRKLKNIRLSGMAEELKRQHETWKDEHLSAEERIIRLIDAESDMRDSKKFERLLKASGIRYKDASLNHKLLESEGVDRSLLERLATEDWTEEGTNLLITGKTGAGKTYCACALAVALMARFKTVRYFKAGELLRILQNAESRMELTQELNKLSRYDLLIVDDFGLMNLNMEMCRNLFELIDVRDGRKSNIFISQFPVSEWYEMFKDNTYADACLDRLTGGARRLEFLGESRRLSRN